jgi:hypothetical protein
LGDVGKLTARPGYPREGGEEFRTYSDAVGTGDGDEVSDTRHV